MRQNEEASSAITQIINALQQRRFHEAETGAIAEIRKAPLVPQIWVLLGESLLHQGFGHAARKAFDRAWMLDPQADWVGSVRRTLAQTPLGEPRPDIDELLRVKRVSVTIGIIVRDEERVIQRCLSSLQGAADEIVLIDCESVDRTVEIARSFPNVRIVHTRWNEDFAALRNEGLANMTTDWVLWVDADEHLHPDDIGAVREVAGLYDEMDPVAVLYVWQLNEFNGTVLHEFSQTRMFPLRRGLCYHGRIHEQVGPAEGGPYSGVSFRKPVRIRLLHDGYEPEIIRSKDKLQRNLRLLDMMVKEDPMNPGWWTYYARESLSAGLTDQALNGLRMAEETARSQPNFARLLDVYMLTAKIRISRREWPLAEEACRKALERYPQFPDAHFYLAIVKMRQSEQLQREAEQALRQAKAGFAYYRGTVTPDREIAKWKADATLADIARAVGKFGDAALIYRKIAEMFPYAEQVQRPLRLIDEQIKKLKNNDVL